MLFRSTVGGAHVLHDLNFAAARKHAQADGCLLYTSQTEWAAWMEREKEALTEIAQRHDFEIISLGTNRPHRDLPQFKDCLLYTSDVYKRQRLTYTRI